MNPSTLIINEGAPGKTELTVLTVYADRTVRNTAPDRTSMPQATALAAYTHTIIGGTLLTTGQTITTVTGQTFTAL